MKLLYNTVLLLGGIISLTSCADGQAPYAEVFVCNASRTDIITAVKVASDKLDLVLVDTTKDFDKTAKVASVENGGKESISLEVFDQKKMILFITSIALPSGKVSSAFYNKGDNSQALYASLFQRGGHLQKFVCDK